MYTLWHHTGDDVVKILCIEGEEVYLALDARGHGLHGVQASRVVVRGDGYGVQLHLSTPPRLDFGRHRRRVAILGKDTFNTFIKHHI